MFVHKHESRAIKHQCCEQCLPSPPPSSDSLLPFVPSPTCPWPLNFQAAVPCSPEVLGAVRKTGRRILTGVQEAYRASCWCQLPTLSVPQCFCPVTCSVGCPNCVHRAGNSICVWLCLEGFLSVRVSLFLLPLTKSW